MNGSIQQVTDPHLLAVFGAHQAQDHAQRSASGLGCSTPPWAVDCCEDLALPLAACFRAAPHLLSWALEGDPGITTSRHRSDFRRIFEALQVADTAPGTVVCSEAAASWIKGMVRLQAVYRSGCGSFTLPKVYTVWGCAHGACPSVAGAPAARSVCGAYARTGYVTQATCPGRGRPRPDGGHSRCTGQAGRACLPVPAPLAQAPPDVSAWTFVCPTVRRRHSFGSHPPASCLGPPWIVPVTAKVPPLGCTGSARSV